MKYEQKEFTSPFPSKEFLSTVRPNGHILDFGCGYGRVAEYLTEQNFKVFGIDNSVALIEKANNLRLKNAQFIQGSVNQIPSEQVFDAAILCAVLEYFPEEEFRQDLINKIHDSLFAGGTVYISSFIQDERYSSKYAEEIEKGKKHGLIMFEDLSLYHDTSEGIDALLGIKFNKLFGEDMKFKTWNNNLVNGYRSVYQK